MVKPQLSNPLSTGDAESDPYAEMDEPTLREEIDSAKAEFIELNIAESKTRMFQLAKDLAEMNAALADRKGGDPTAEQYEDAAAKWDDVADLVLDGTDPTESLQSGSEGDGAEIDADIDQFHEGVPDNSFDDVGGYEDVKETLRENAIKLLQHREFLQGELNQTLLNGLVLTGPPGTGKTLMAKSFAGELHETLDDDITLFKIKPGGLKRGVRGESGKLMRGLFAAAKRAQPALLIFEEVDTLIQDRSETSVQTMRSDQDLTSAFLDEVTEIDDEDVVVMGTSNRADVLDDAATRPNRIETVEMGLPDAKTRVEIFRIHLRSVPEEYVDWDDVELPDLAVRANGLSGAGIAAVVDDAILSMGLAFIDGDREQPLLTHDDLVAALADRVDADD